MAEIHHLDPKPPEAAGTEGSRGVFRGTWIAAAVLLLVTVIFYWKITFTVQYLWYDHPDMVYQEIPRLQFQARELRHGHFPLWDPYIWCGQPLIGQTQPGPLFPLNYLFYAAPFRGGFLSPRALNTYYVAIHFLAAFFLVLLARQAGASPLGAVVGGIVFGFAGFLATVAWLDVLNGAIWAPLVFLFLWRSLESARPMREAAWGGVFLGVAFLSGHHETPLMLGLAVGLTWVVLCIRDRRRIPQALAFLLIGGLVASAQMLPTLEFGHLSTRWVGIERALTWGDRVPYRVHGIYSLPAHGLLALVFPGGALFGDAGVYIGWIAAILAVAGAFACWRYPQVRWAVGLAAAALIFSLGENTPFHGLFYLFPGFEKARVPSRAIYLANMSFGLLAALGLDSIANRLPKLSNLRLHRAFLGAGALMLGLGILGPVLQRGELDLMILPGVLLIVAALFVAARAGFTQLRWAFLLLVILEIYPQSTSRILASDPKVSAVAGSLYRFEDIARFLTTEPGPVRVMADDAVVPINFGDWYGMDSTYGYTAGVTSNVVRHEMHTARTQDLFAITHRIGKREGRTYPDEQEVFASSSGAVVFRNPHALARWRIVHNAVSVPTEGHLRLAIQDPAIDLSKTAVFLGPAPKLATCGGGDSVSLVRRDTDHTVLRTESECRGLLVVADTMYPGWEALVDGKPAPVLEAYGALQSVVIEPGSHRVELLFRPKSVYRGAGLAILGLMIAVGLSFNLRGKPPRRV